MEIYNKILQTKHLANIKNFILKTQTLPIKEITEKNLKLASAAIASAGIASIAINQNKENIDLETYKHNILDLILEDENISCDRELSSILKGAIEITETIEDAEIKYRAIKSIISNKEFPKDLIAKILELTNEQNIALAEKICADKEFPKKWIDLILKSTNEQNISLAEKLCADKEFPKNWIATILEGTDEKNVESKIKMYDLLSADKEFPKYMIAKILGPTDEHNISLAEKICADKEFPKLFIVDILESTNEQNIESKSRIYDLLKNDKDIPKVWVANIIRVTNGRNIESKSRIYDLLKNDKDFPKKLVANIIWVTNGRNITFVEKLCADKDFPKEWVANTIRNTHKQNIAYLINQDISALQDGVNLQLKKVLEAPKKYINGEYSSESEMIDAVNRYFERNAGSLMVFSAIFDKEAFNHLLRMRFNDVDEYISIIKGFEPSDLDLLSMMKNAVNIDGKPFLPTQKVEFIDLLQAYKANGLDLTPIKQMTEAGQIDLGKLHINLFNQIMKNSGLSDAEIASIPKEKLTSWDTKYAHLLSKEIQENRDIAFSDILRAGTLEPDFMKYIHDTGNIYGQANARTQAMFAESGLDYEKWIHPSKDAEMKFTVKDKNTERLAQIADQILEDIETLRLGPVKGFIDKQFPHCIKDGKFIIPTEVMGSKAKLNEFIENIIKQLDGVWKRAQGNATNPDPKRAQTARGTLTILDHLNQRIKDVSAISEDKVTKSLDWTIKMWDRVPQKDIFQGNYSTCCIGLGGGNGAAMPHYVMNTAYNMIELVDNNSGRTIGNALCYFVKGVDGKLAFIIDNVEIANSVKPSDDVGESLRAMLTDYASKIAEDVTGSKDIPVYLGPDYNDIPYEDLPKHVEEVTFLGDIDCDEIYMDAFGASADWTNKADFTQKVELLKL